MLHPTQHLLWMLQLTIKHSIPIMYTMTSISIFQTSCSSAKILYSCWHIYLCLSVPVFLCVSLVPASHPIALSLWLLVTSSHRLWLVVGRWRKECDFIQIEPREVYTSTAGGSSTAGDSGCGCCASCCGVWGEAATVARRLGSTFHALTYTRSVYVYHIYAGWCFTVYSLQLRIQPLHHHMHTPALRFPLSVTITIDIINMTALFWHTVLRIYFLQKQVALWLSIPFWYFHTTHYMNDGVRGRHMMLCWCGPSNVTHSYGQAARSVVIASLTARAGCSCDAATLAPRSWLLLLLNN